MRVLILSSFRLYYVFVKRWREGSLQIFRIIRVLFKPWFVSSLSFFVVLMVWGGSSITFRFDDSSWEQPGVVEVDRRNVGLSILVDINGPINWKFCYFPLWKTNKRIFRHIVKSWSERRHYLRSFSLFLHIRILHKLLHNGRAASLFNMCCVQSWSFYFRRRYKRNILQSFVRDKWM